MSVEEAKTLIKEANAESIRVTKNGITLRTAKKESEVPPGTSLARSYPSSGVIIYHPKIKTKEELLAPVLYELRNLLRAEAFVQLDKDVERGVIADRNEYALKKEKIEYQGLVGHFNLVRSGAAIEKWGDARKGPPYDTISNGDMPIKEEVYLERMQISGHSEFYRLDFDNLTNPEQ